jgi:glycosyltransferase involved in cell wall biosynthesis/SAM-dependent methyltransferase
MPTNTMLAFTGERFVPEISGNIELEHMHRYIFASSYAHGKIVLDIASGEGYGAALLAKQAAFVTGVDIAEDAVAHSKEKYRLPNLEFRVGSCSKIPLPDSTVDLVVSFETIEHHDEHELMLSEIKRVLKPDGIVIVSSPDKAIYTEKPDYHNPFHVKELYRDEFEALFGHQFKNVVGLGQKLIFGSGIIPCGQGYAAPFISVEIGAAAAHPGLLEAIYNLVLASDAELPAAPASFLDVGVDASETVKSWSAAVAQRDGEIQRLQGEFAATQRRSDGIIAEKEAVIAEKDARLTEQRAQIAEQRAQIAEYLYHLERINSWGWFRLGLFLDKLVHAPIRLIAKQRSEVIANDRPDSIADTRTNADGSGKSSLARVTEAATAPSGMEQTRYRAKVSAIIPNYNHKNFLEQRIDSVINQSYKNIEIVILDDGSTDGSQDIIEYYCKKYGTRIKSVINDVNSGSVFLQWKKGIDNSDGDLIWICESDDFCETDFLEIMVGDLEDRSVNLAFGRIQFSDSKGNLQPGLDDYREGAEPGIWGKRICRPARKWFTRGFGVNNVIANVGGCVWRRQMLSEAVWKEAQTYTVLGDWFLFCHLAGGGQIVYNPNAVAYFRQHGKNTSVSAFTTPPYYAEHERLMKLLRKQWDVPGDTVETFYDKVAEQYRYFNVTSKSGPLENFVRKDDILNVRRDKPHILMAFLGFHVGGGEVFPINLANALHDRGHTVSMLALDMSQVNAGMLASLNPGIAVYDSRHLEEVGIDEFMDDAGVSIIHSHMLSLDMFFFNKMRMRRKIPYLVTLHGSYEAIPIDDGSLLRIIKGVSQWVYLAEKNLEVFKSIPLNWDRFVKLANAMPIDPRPFPQTRDDLGIPKDAVVFTLVARGIKQKGWEESILAFVRLRDENPRRKLHLLLCGEGEEPSRLAQRYAKDANITFLGYQSRISGLYRISDCAIVPTRFTGESFPLCIIQAMQVGTPIIATKIGEIEEMIARPGRVAGLLIENDHNNDTFTNALKIAMQAMLEDSLRRDFAAAAKLNGSVYDIRILADQYYALYRGLALNTCGESIEATRLSQTHCVKALTTKAR